MKESTDVNFPDGIYDDTKIPSVLIHKKGRAFFTVPDHEGCFIMENDGNVIKDPECKDGESLTCAYNETCDSEVLSDMIIAQIRDHLQDMSNEE